MTPGVRPLVAGNWKMHGLAVALGEIEAMRRAADAGEAGSAELAIFPPFTLLAQAAAKLKGGKLALGAQDCHAEPSGAYTGDISAPMIRDAGAAYVIVGHSERRTMHQETDAMVQAKAEAGLKAGLAAIVCVGETRTEREAGETKEIVSRQLKGSLPPSGAPDTMIVAYEPIWAIGTGLIPTPAYVDRHAQRNPRSARRVLRRGWSEGSHSLRRLRETCECQGDTWLTRRGRGPGRRREPEGRGFSRDRRLVPLRKREARVVDALLAPW